MIACNWCTCIHNKNNVCIKKDIVLTNVEKFDHDKKSFDDFLICDSYSINKNFIYDGKAGVNNG